MLGLNEIIKIGDKLKSYRKNLKITQAEMATKLNLPRSTYANYENNTRELNTETLNKIAVVLGVTIGDLVGTNGKPKFSTRLRDLREEMKLTQHDLSERLEISLENIYYYENGGEPNFNTLNKIADYFSVTTDFLTGRSNFQRLDDELFMKLASKSAESKHFFIDEIEITEEYKTDMNKIINNTISSLNQAITNYFEMHTKHRVEVNNILINIIKNLTELINLTLELSMDSNYKYCLNPSLMNEDLKIIFINNDNALLKLGYTQEQIKNLRSINNDNKKSNKSIKTLHDLSEQLKNFNSLYFKITIDLSHMSDIVCFGLNKFKQEYIQNLSTNINTLADFSKKLF